MRSSGADGLAELPLWLPRLSRMTTSPGAKVCAQHFLDVKLTELAVDVAVDNSGRAVMVSSIRIRRKHQFCLHGPLSVYGHIGPTPARPAQWATGSGDKDHSQSGRLRNSSGRGQTGWRSALRRGACSRPKHQPRRRAEPPPPGLRPESRRHFSAWPHRSDECFPIICHGSSSCDEDRLDSPQATLGRAV